MIKVLDKTFGILEEIIKATPHPMGPMALAEALELNRATCSRILKMLLDSGYIIQVSRQAGYVAGPRILTLNNMAMFQSKLMKKALPVIDRAAEAVQDSVPRRNNWRIMMPFPERIRCFLSSESAKK